jgi:hypothetical protein
MTTTASSTIATDGSYTDLVAAELKCASLRAKLLATEVDSIHTALCGSFIDTDTAIAWANEIGAFSLIATSSTIITST